MTYLQVATVPHRPRASTIHIATLDRPFKGWRATTAMPCTDKNTSTV